MNEKDKALYDLCDTITKELDEINDKIQRGGGMSAGDLETVDKLSHALKSIKTTIAMIEADESGYSGTYPVMRYYYNDGTSYRRGAKRDSMGRYSGHGYS